jgi:hypothetical protein
MLEDENHPEAMNYVYNSNSNYYDYALLNFYSFINGRLVAAGLKNDSTFEPTLTTNFTHWKNEVFDSGNVEADSKVVILTDLKVPINPYDKKDDLSKKDKNSDGYLDGSPSEMEIDLKSALTSKINALVGKEVREYGDGEFSFTLTSASSSTKGLSFDLDGTSGYLYTVYAIESILEKKMPDYDCIIFACRINPMTYLGGTNRINWDNIMSFWRGVGVAHPRVVFVSFGDPYKLYELSFLKTYVNAYSADPATMRAFVKVLLGEIPAMGKSPVALKGFFERETD